MKTPPCRSLTAQDIKTLGLSPKETQPLPEPFIIAEGDWGGQIYFSIPVRLVKNEQVLNDVLTKIDHYCWHCNEGAGCGYRIANYVFEANALCSGGMGGGDYGTDLWVHRDLEPFKTQIHKALTDGASLIVPEPPKFP